MALSDFVIQSSTVEFPGGSFTVRGLTLTDLVGLVLEQKDSLEQAFDFAEANNIHAGQINGEIGLKLLQTLPGLCASVIAIAADEPGMVEKAGKLPPLAQVSALESIAKLTFTDAAGFRAVVGKVMAAVQGTVGALPPGPISEQLSSDGSPE